MSSGLVGDVAVHPLEFLVSGLEALTAEAAAGLAWTLTPSQLAELIPRLAVVSNQLDAVKLGMLREADRHQVGDPRGFANTAGWFATVTRTTKPAGHRAVALATSLDDDAHVVTREAAARGAVSVEQAQVIIRAVEKLPKDLVDPATKARAEADLVAFAAVHGPRELGFLGRRILEHIAPDIAEEAERRVLENEEHTAAATASLVMGPDGHGSVIGRFKIPVLAGAILAKHLAAIAAPKHQNATSTGTGTGTGVATDPGTGERLDRPQRLGAAFVEYLETREASGMPKAGGLPATLVVTMTLESLLGGAAAATLDTGDRISAAEARRLACEAGIIPAVLGGRSQPLDVGRRRRFHTEAQRIAIGLRDRTCRIEHCDHPPAMCHVHHLHQWAHGGRTNTTDAILLCPRHHTLAHDSRYDMKLLANDQFKFIRRT